MIQGQMPPILSVVIVTYKSRDEIGECLRSLPRELKGRTVEVILVDNASGDGIGQIIREEFPWVYYLESSTNLGFGKASNLAYERALGEYVLFLNPDTISHEASFLHCLARFRQDPSIGIISP